MFVHSSGIYNFYNNDLFKCDMAMWKHPNCIAVSLISGNETTKFPFTQNNVSIRCTSQNAIQAYQIILYW